MFNYKSVLHVYWDLRKFQADMSLKCGNLYSILEILEILDTIYSHETSFNNVCYVL